MGKFLFFDTNPSNSSVYYYLEPDPYPSITDIVEGMNTHIQDRHHHTDFSITVKVSRRRQKVEIHLANEEGSCSAVFSTELGHIFESNDGNDFGLLLRGERPQKPVFAYDIVRIHSLTIYTDLIEYNIVDDKKAPLLRFFPILSKLKARGIIAIGQNMNYETFSNLQFRLLLKTSVQSIHIELRDTSGTN